MRGAQRLARARIHARVSGLGVYGEHLIAPPRMNTCRRVDLTPPLLRARRKIHPSPGRNCRSVLPEMQYFRADASCPTKHPMIDSFWPKRDVVATTTCGRFATLGEKVAPARPLFAVARPIRASFTKL